MVTLAFAQLGMPEAVRSPEALREKRDLPTKEQVSEIADSQERCVLPMEGDTGIYIPLGNYVFLFL